METTTSTIYDLPLVAASITRHVYLTEAFEKPSDYITTCQALIELEEYDVAEIHICSGGGCTSVSNMICNAMVKSKASIHCVLESNADSAASVIFLNGDSFEVTPNATMHLHNGYFSSYGDKAHEVVHNSIFTEKSHFNMIRLAYEGFLVSDEIDNLLKGQDFLLTSDEIVERLGGLMEYRERKFAEGVGVEEEEEDPLSKIKAFAEEAHIGQLYGDKPYIHHLKNVYEMYMRLNANISLTEQCLCWLHDVYEDCEEVTLESLLEEGFSKDLVEAVDAISKRGGESRKEYLIRCMNNPYAHKVKIADTLSNLTESVKVGDIRRVDLYTKQLNTLHKG